MKKMIAMVVMLVGFNVFAQEAVIVGDNVPACTSDEPTVTIVTTEEFGKSELEAKFDKIMNLLADKIIKLLETGNEGTN